MSSDDFKENVQNKETWIRGLYILLFVVAYSIVEILVLAIVIYQFLSLLITSTTNQRFEKLGADLSRYIYQIMRYLTFNTDVKPYPFAEFPNAKSFDD